MNVITLKDALGSVGLRLSDLQNNAGATEETLVCPTKDGRAPWLVASDEPKPGRLFVNGGAALMAWGAVGGTDYKFRLNQSIAVEAYDGFLRLVRWA